MKLKYTFEIMEMDDQVVAVPVGDNADGFRGILKLNQTAAEILNLLMNEKSIDEIKEELAKKYSSDIGEIDKAVDDFIANLIKENILE